MIEAIPVLLILVLLLLATLIHAVLQNWQIPLAAVLVLIGFAGSELITAAGFDLGIRWEHFGLLVFNVLVPLLVFESAVRMSSSSLVREWPGISLLVLPLMLIGTMIIAVLLYYGIGHPGGFPLLAAVITALILAATDSTVILDLLKRWPGSGRLVSLLDGESLFNDATTIVLFGMLINLALSVPDAALSIAADQWPRLLLGFLLVSVGGFATGLILGSLASCLLGVIRQENARALLTLITAYSAWILADSLLGLSGVMAILAAGLQIGKLSRQSRASEEEIKRFWQFNAHIAYVLIFLLAGITFTPSMFSSHWLAMLIGIVSVIVARSIFTLGLFWPLMNILPLQGLSWRQAVMVNLAGSRGTVSLALALSLPVGLPYWYSIQSLVYGVVLYDICVQPLIVNGYLSRQHNSLD